MARIDLNNMKNNNEWCTPLEAIIKLEKEFNISNMNTVDVAGNKDSEYNVFAKELDTQVLYGDFLTNTFDIPNIYPGNHNTIIITNPPFSLKDDFINKAYNDYINGYNRGFALLLPIQALQGLKRAIIFKLIEKDMLLRIFSNRIKYLYPQGEQSTSCMFGSCWILYGACFMDKHRSQLRWY